MGPTPGKKKKTMGTTSDLWGFVDYLIVSMLIPNFHSCAMVSKMLTLAEAGGKLYGNSPLFL